MKRGDLVTVVFPGDFGKPRPAVVVQADDFDTLTSVTVLPLTSDVMNARNTRISLVPSARNGLHHRSSVMIEKIGTLPSTKVGLVFGRLSEDDLAAVTGALAIFLGIV